MRLQNQIVVEWTIRNYYSDFSFERNLEDIVKNIAPPLAENEAYQIHQVVNVGEFNQEKVFLIILNIVPKIANKQ